MKLHKSLFAAFLVMLMTIFSCSEESVLTANAEREIGSADDSGIKLTVEIAAPITRTVRPMITKYTVELQIGNGSTEEESEDSSWNTMISRTLNAHNTSTTFTNISIANYRIVVSGYDKNNKKILEGISNISATDFGSSNLLSQVEVTDYFGESTNNGTGSITFNLYGLENFYTENINIIMKLTKAGSSGNNSSGNGSSMDDSSEVKINLAYEKQTQIFSGTNGTINSGSYIITCENNLGFNLVQDPLVNIYAGATTEINWTFNYNKDNVSSDTTLKNIKIPVWKVPVNYNSESSAEVTNCAGYISANALFAKPTFIDAGEYVSSAYDSNNDLWILTKDSSSNYYITNSNSKNQLDFGNTGIKLVDFTFTQVDESEKILFLDIFDNTCKIYSSSAFALSENKFTDILIHLNMDNNLTPTAVTANGNDVYIAASSTTTESQSTVGAVSVYKGDLSSVSQGTITFLELKVADDNNGKTLGEDLVGRFNFNIPTCFRVTDMYSDDSALYITAGALCLNVGSDSGKISSSFGGLFKYTVDNNGNATHTYDTGIASNMVKDEYRNVLSVPRCIVPVKNALYIVDSGFCGTADESGEMKATGKCNRICVFSNRNELDTSTKFTVTDLHDLADFDFSGIMNVFNTNDNNGYCWSF